MQIEGAGTISADHTSLDIHLEMTKINDSQPSVANVPPATLPAAIPFIVQSTRPYAAWYQQDKPSFGVETGKGINCTGCVRIPDDVTI